MLTSVYYDRERPRLLLYDCDRGRSRSQVTLSPCRLPWLARRHLRESDTA